MNKNISIDAEKFLMLAVKAAKANGVVVEEEKELLRRYSLAADHIYSDVPDDSTTEIEALTEYFAALTVPQKKRVLFEVLDVMYADHLFDEPECNFVYDLAISMGFEENELDRILSMYRNGKFINRTAS